MERLRDIMKTPVITIEPGEHIGRARTRMEWAGVHHLPVVANGELVGVVSMNDVRKSRRWADRDEEDQWTDDIPIERVMSRPAIALAPDASLAKAVLLLRRRAIGCVPIVDRGNVVGIVTRTDLQPIIERVFHDSGSRAASGPPIAAPPESTASPRTPRSPRGLQH